MRFASFFGSFFRCSADVWGKRMRFFHVSLVITFQFIHGGLAILAIYIVSSMGGQVFAHGEVLASGAVSLGSTKQFLGTFAQDGLAL